MKGHRPKRIVWFSRNEPLPSQIAELKRLYGEDCEVLKDQKPLSSAEDVVRRFRMNEGDEMVTVAPMSVIKEICKLGVEPLWAEMEQITDPWNRDDVEMITGLHKSNDHIVSQIQRGGAAIRGLKFLRYRKIKDILMVWNEDFDKQFYPQSPAKKLPTPRRVPAKRSTQQIG
jgi:hypothetical protein